MATTIENSGDIEVLTDSEPHAGDSVNLVFRVDDAEPPFQLKVRSPTGKVILETILRELPTQIAQSGQPIRFVASVAGDYKIEIRQTKGSQKGEARLRVAP